ncbi:MAG TPA: hypothetical protein PLE57_08460, partial [Methanoregulaceae archaeon]|nr:hypothetical protein [Methanoregulaceae archaeon]
MPVPHRLLVLSILALLLGTLLVAGCLTEQPAAETPAAVRMSDLTIYTEQVPPYNYLENGTTQGISVDLFEL